MKDLQSYISSGILELYVSGKLSPEEAREVEAMAEKYPEIQGEIQAIEEAVGEWGAVYKKAPSRDLLSGVLAAIEEGEEDQAVILPLPEKKDYSRFRWIAIAASVAFLLSLLFNFFQFQRIQQANGEIASLNEKNQSLMAEIDQSNEQFAVVSNPGYRVIDMVGTDFSPESRARVYYNSALKKTFLQSGNLQILDTNTQLQLWAIIDGSPVDAGIFNPADGLIEVKALEGNIAAFAITLEPKGGSRVPTLDQMMVLGKMI